MREASRPSLATADEAPIRLQAHPPERRRRSVIVASPSCCCCCCCCLHSAGGLVGATVGSISPQAPGAALAYWAVLLGLTLLSIAVGPLYLLWGEDGSTGQNATDVISDGLGGALCLLIMFLPAVQLAASLVATVVVAAAPSRSLGQSKGASFLAIGKITLGMIVGSLLGLGVMYGIAVAMSSSASH